MFNKQQIAEMVKLQYTLNSNTAGEYWFMGVTNLGKIIDWGACLAAETTELLESFPWKHWKDVDAEVDRDNVAIELVDILHFINSSVIEMTAIDLLTKKHIEAGIKLPISKSELSLVDTNNVQMISQDEIIDLTINIMNNMISLLDISKLDTSSDKEIDYIKPMLHSGNDIVRYLKYYITYLKYLEEKGLLDLENIYGLYLGKNALNKVRQDNGYKEGVYKKIWSDGNEDNVHLYNHIMNSPSTTHTFDSLYSDLSEMYMMQK
jgi:dimeric dUTPase (all-alpha-NTP-PPase superfamily)